MKARWKQFGEWLQKNDANVAGFCMFGLPVIIMWIMLIVYMIRKGWEG